MKMVIDCGISENGIDFDLKMEITQGNTCNFVRQQKQTEIVKRNKTFLCSCCVIFVSIFLPFLNSLSEFSIYERYKLLKAEGQVSMEGAALSHPRILQKLLFKKKGKLSLTDLMNIPWATD